MSFFGSSGMLIIYKLYGKNMYMCEYIFTVGLFTKYVAYN